MKILSCDLETHLIQPGCIAPRMVCLSYHDGTDTGLLGGDENGRRKAMNYARSALEGAAAGLWKLGGQYFCFDLAVLAAEDPSLIPIIFAAYDKGMIWDTKFRQMLIDNATGELKFIEDEHGDIKAQDFSLQALVKRHLNKWISKGEDTWRLRYNELDGTPIDQWPENARKYAIDDAVLTYDVYQAQERLVEPEGIPGEAWTMQAAWALYLAQLWGVRTDGAAVEKMSAVLTEELEKLQSALKQKVDDSPSGVPLIREEGTRDMKAIKALVEAAFAAKGEPVPQTDGGATSTSKDTLVRTGDPRLKKVSEAVHTQKLLTTYVPMLKLGTQRPINCSYNPILETFRTSCAKPNLQQLPRKGDARGCFIPRPGHVYIGSDYDTAELRSLAQVLLDLFGRSAMADALRADKDLHLDLAATFLNTSYEFAVERHAAGDKEFDEARQFSKISNFGLPGGMSAPTLQDYARSSYEKDIPLEVCYQIHADYRHQFPEMLQYFEYCSRLAGDSRAPRITFLRSGMVRGQVKYTAVCNGFFQHLTAMGAKAALYDVSKECYVGTTPEGKPSPLFGSRPVLFLHDEILIETPYHPERASLAADRLALVMKTAMERWITDVPVKCSSVMMRRWLKGAKALRVDGLLVPTRPVDVVGTDGSKKTTWVADVEAPPGAGAGAEKAA